MVMTSRRSPSRERGASRVGCLFLLLVFAAVAYFGLPVGVQAFRYYQFKDALATQVRFAGQSTDPIIRRNILASIKDLGLPDEAARNLTITRGGQPLEILIRTSYTITFEIPYYVRPYTFKPEARGRI
jgi:hypothetical protein